MVMKRLLSLRPAMVGAILPVLILIGANIGLNIEDQINQWGTTILAILAVVPLIQAWWTQGEVTPNDKVVERLDADYGLVTAGPGNDRLQDGEFVRYIGDDDEDLVNLS